MRVFDRDLIRGGHYGQRSCEPHLQAEHMAAPTNAAKREESSCQPGAVHTWHKTRVPTALTNVRNPERTSTFQQSNWQQRLISINAWCKPEWRSAMMKIVLLTVA